jgi:hypothetical protein
MAIVALAAAGALPLPAMASEPAGVWLIVDDVTLLPNADQPTSVRIVGLVTLHSGTGPISGWGYSGFEPPQRGTLYYTCPAGKETICQAEWRELRDSRGRCVGFGSVSVDSGRLRTDGGLGTPDVYPISLGIVTGHTPCELLETAAAGGGDAGAPDAAVGAAGEPSAPSAAAGASAKPPPLAGDAGTSTAGGARSTPSAAADSGVSGSSAAMAAAGQAGKSSTGQAGDGSAHLVSSCAVHRVGQAAADLACWWAAVGLATLRIQRWRRRGCAVR